MARQEHLEKFRVREYYKEGIIFVLDLVRAIASSQTQVRCLSIAKVVLFFLHL